MRACYLVRGRMRVKFVCEESDGEVLSLLKKAMRAGVSPSAMHEAVEENNTLEGCFVSMGIERFEFRVAMGDPIVDLSSKRKVFISEKDPEWRIWNAHLRGTRSIDPPMNKDFGWFFPSRLPPTDPQPRKPSRG